MLNTQLLFSKAVTPSVAGTVNVFVQVNPIPIRVDYFVDGVLLTSRTNSNDFDFDWDTTAHADGAHTISAVAVFKNSRKDTDTKSVTIVNAVSPPADVTPPTVPGSFAKTAGTETTITTTWNASTDAVGVVSYNLYRNNELVGSVPVANPRTYIFTGLTCGTSYSLSVEAVDAAGNMSAKSTITAATANCPTVLTYTSSIKNGDIVEKGSTWTVTTDPDATLVEFWANGVKLAEDTTEPFSTVINLPAGAHAIGLCITHDGVRTCYGSGGVYASITVKDPVAPPPPPPVGQVLFEGGFETGDQSQWAFVHEYTPDRFKVVTSDGAVLPRKGNYMARIETRQGEPAAWASTLNATMAQKGGIPETQLGKDVYMGWSVWVPSSFPWQSQIMHNVIAEWHGTAGMIQAPYHFGIDCFTGQWFVDLHRDASGYNPVFGRAQLGAYNANQWVDWVQRIKWSTGTDGIFETWKNGVKVFSWTGRTWNYPNVAVYPELGLYKENKNNALIYVDAFRVGTTFAAVDPGSY